MSNWATASEHAQIEEAIRRSKADMGVVEDGDEKGEPDGDADANADVDGGVDVFDGLMPGPMADMPMHGDYFDMIFGMLPGIAYIDRHFVMEALTFMNTCARNKCGGLGLMNNITTFTGYIATCKAIRYIARLRGLNWSMDGQHLVYAIHVIQAFGDDLIHSSGEATVPFIQFHMPMTNAVAYAHVQRRLGPDLTTHLMRFIFAPIAPRHNIAKCFRMFRELSPGELTTLNWIKSLGITKDTTRSSTPRARATHISICPGLGG